MQVNAPDGGVNLRYGAGTEYDILLDGLIPNGTILHITREAPASNGNYWGYTVYNGIYGWIALSQVRQIESSAFSQEVYLGGNAANYDVEVSAPDGGVNLRFGPGTEYSIRISMIPNATALHVNAEISSSTGSTWGYTSNNGLDGWIALSQVTKLQAPTATPTPQATETPAATPTAEETPTATPTKEATKAPESTETESPSPTAASNHADENGITISYALLTKLLVVLCIALILALTAVLILFKKHKK